MPNRFEQYRFQDGRTPLSATTFNTIFGDIDLRVANLEQFRTDYDLAVQQAAETGLERINAVLLPMVEQIQADVDRANADLTTLLAQANSDIAALVTQAQADIDAAVLAAETAAANVQAEIDAALAEPDSAAYTYDANGRVASVSETVGVDTRTTVLTYDANGRVDTKEVTFRGVQRTETFTYDAQGRIDTMTATAVVI